ncbi:MAG: hypothetical protein IT456_10325 [Planctomycetes bacterium]|nr:hypothetical protein [Planctomycetota bacterium]
MPKFHPRRRRIVVDRPFQWSLCLHGILQGLFVLCAVSFGIFAPLLWQLGERAPNAVTDVDSAIVMLYMHERFWTVAGLCLLLVTFAALRMSHRIAGPLVRYKRNLRLIADGRLPPPLRTRARDYLKEEVVCLNEAVQGVRERVDAIRSAAALARRELQVVVDQGAEVSKAKIASLVEAQRQLEVAIQRFEETGDLDGLPAYDEGRASLSLAFAGSGREEG